VRGRDASFYREFYGVDGSVDKVFALLLFSIYLPVGLRVKECGIKFHAHTCGGMGKSSGKTLINAAAAAASLS